MAPGPELTLAGRAPVAPGLELARAGKPQVAAGPELALAGKPQVAPDLTLFHGLDVRRHFN